MNKQTVQLKGILEGLYAKYNRRELIKPDPLQFVYRYSNPADMEVAGFLAAELAYGKVQQIEKSLSDLFGRMGRSPHEFVKNFGKTEERILHNFKHRFTTGDDLSALLTLLKKVFSQYGSIQKFFIQGYSRQDKNIVPALSKFCDSLLNMHASANNGHVTRGLRYLLPGPASGSACKRLNLFLRWMVRKDDVDAGLWNSIDKAKLIVPVDVHMGRLCRILGLYSRKSISLSAAAEITESFSRFEPTDPVKYDFALSRIGILKNCTGRSSEKCRQCELLGFCDDAENLEEQAKNDCEQEK